MPPESKIFLVKNLQTLKIYPHLPWKTNEILGISQLELNLVIEGKKVLTAAQVGNLSLALEISIDTLLFSILDISFLDQKYQNKYYMPDIYLPAGGFYARSKTIHLIVNFINSHIHENLGHILKNRLNISSNLFIDLNYKIHPNLVIDAIKETTLLGMSSELLTLIGASTDITSFNKNYTYIISLLKETRHVLDFIHEEIIGMEYDNLFPDYHFVVQLFFNIIS